MFTFEPGVAIWTLVSFGIFFFAILKFVYPKMGSILEERRTRIETDIEEARKAREEIESVKKDLETRLSAIKVEELRILSEAQEKSRRATEEYEKELFEEFRRLRADKEEHLKRMEANFLKASEERITKIIVDTCERVLQTELSAEQHRKIVERGIRTLETMKGI